jgi:hypothetical protein
LLTDSSTATPVEVHGYLRQLRNSTGNQAFVLGDPRSIDSSVMAQLDRDLAPGPPAN